MSVADDTLFYLLGVFLSVYLKAEEVIFALMSLHIKGTPVLKRIKSK